MGKISGTAINPDKKVTLMIHSATIILAILALGFLIFIHELGHFFAAKRCGIRVEKFSIGFGPRLIGFRRGETDYCISALPFGGFVKMAGESPDEQRGEEGEFASAPVGHRIFVAIAGTRNELHTRSPPFFVCVSYWVRSRYDVVDGDASWAVRSVGSNRVGR